MENINLDIKRIRADQVHKKIPELRNIFGSGVIEVAEGDFRVGYMKSRYRSYNLDVCTAIVLKQEESDKSGLIHIYPEEELKNFEDNHLELLRGARATIIEGSNSTQKDTILRFIFDRYDLVHDHTIKADTLMLDGKSAPFHIVYRPYENGVMVARISHEDFKFYKAFNI